MRAGGWGHVRPYTSYYLLLLHFQDALRLVKLLNKIILKICKNINYLLTFS